MLSARLIRVVFAIIIFVNLPAQAQIFNCDGTWQNQPCANGSGMSALPEVKTTPNPKSAEIEAKKVLVQSIVSSRYSAKKEFGIELDSSAVEKYCELETTTIDQCHDRIDQFQQRLDNRVIEKEKLRLKERELEVTRRSGDSNDLNNVVVIQNMYSTPTPTPLYPPYPPIIETRPINRTPGNMLTRRPDVPAPSRNEVKNDARVPYKR